MTSELYAIADLIAKHLPPSADRVRVRPLDATAREWMHGLARRHYVRACESGSCDATLGADLVALPRFLHLLVQQTPPARGWDQPDPASIRWQATTVRDTVAKRIMLLGFSSLVKAVGFMKPAAMAGAVQEVNKLPRYRGEVVAGWSMSVLLDPDFERLRENARFTFESEPLRVEPRLEDKIRE